MEKSLGGKNMEYSQVLENAKKRIGPKCKVCPDCNGRACGNLVPGPGSKGPGNPALTNREGWLKIKLNMDCLCPYEEINTEFEFFGKNLRLPVFTAPVGDLAIQYNEGDDIKDYNDCAIAAASDAGTASFFGDGIVEETLARALEASKANNGAGVPVINPMNPERMKKEIELAKKYNVFLISYVIDSIGLPHYGSLKKGKRTKSVSELKELIDFAERPVIIKGIMTARSAEKALEAGASGIIVSNHGGRAFAEGPSTAEVLPEIAAAVGKDCKIIVDGGIRTGLDVFKALALGADAAMICRPFLISYYGGGKEGILSYFNKLSDELVETMLLTGARKLDDICPEMLRLPKEF